MTNPDMSEFIGTMFDPFIANQGDSLDPALAVEGYYGSGMYALSNDYGKLGPYADAVARHPMSQSLFHRDVDFCGTCHDVSNSAVGHLAPNAGAQPGAPVVIRDSNALKNYAAFQNPPYAYGIVERTYSEYKSSPLSSTLVDAFGTLPADLQDPRGSLYFSYMAATTGGTRSANYIDGAERYFSCQTCHMRAITGRGCDKNNAPNRLDQPMHDQTGGNYWVYPLIQYQDQQGTLRLGGGLTADQIAAMDDGTLRAGEHLTQAATLDVNGNTVRITNMTGHKLISGYPEGRRMWLNIKWYDVSNPIPGVTYPEGRRMWLNIKFYDANGVLVEEIGEWGPLPTTAINPVDGKEFTPWSIVDLNNPKLKVYEVHPAMTQEWAAVLNTLPGKGSIPIGYDRLTGISVGTIASLAAQDPGTHAKSFHFALNNYIADDNRIPPYQMRYDEAKKRNALPVPADQYGNPGSGGAYQHWDELDISKIAPAHAKSADLTLYYQGTSWEYVQFMWLANNGIDPAQGGNAFLGKEGDYFLDAWVNAANPNFEVGNQKMVPPYPMATALWEAECVPNPVKSVIMPQMTPATD
jgi:hypothetical protein